MGEPNTALDQQSQLLGQAEEMLQQLRQGNEQQVTELLEKLTDIKESLLYQEVGKMTRQLHNALDSFRKDSRIESLAAQEIPDARERLAYVMDMTQQAADRTLSAVEQSMPMADDLSAKAGDIRENWDKFKRRELNADEFRCLAQQVESFLQEVEQGSVTLKTNLNEVLMAQDFQDLTGQIIKRVITLVEEVEGNMVEMLRLTGVNPEVIKAPEHNKDNVMATGTAVPGIDNEDRVSNQDDVDDLLSSLGF